LGAFDDGRHWPHRDESENDNVWNQLVILAFAGGARKKGIVAAAGRDRAADKNR
jgi:hypothetical protein